MKTPIRVLVIDDSAFARKVIREILTSDPEIEVVGIARDGLEGLEKIADLRPDVITLDLVMPDLDGMGVLRALPKVGAPRIIVVSASASNSDLAIEALQAGAVDLVTKPTALPTERLYNLSSDLIAKVKAAASANVASLTVKVNPPGEEAPVAIPSKPSTAQIIVIGTSTGGPQALTTLFKSLPSGLPVPIAIALHISAGYTAPLAERLTKLGAVAVNEAVDGHELIPGRAVIAPGGMHLRIVRKAGKFFADVSVEPLSSIYHPSVDILFQSAAEAAESGTLALIMTGMGNDGFEGTKAIRKTGGRVIAESASSCIVYGMPRCAIEGGTSNFEAPLESIAKLLVEKIFV